MKEKIYKRDDSWPPRAVNDRTRKLAAGLLGVCRRINVEAAPVLYGANTFTFHNVDAASHTIGRIGGNFVHLRKLKLGFVKDTIIGVQLGLLCPWLTWPSCMNDFVELMSTLDRKEKGGILELTLGFNKGFNCSPRGGPAPSFHDGQYHPCRKKEVRFLGAVLPFMGQSHCSGEGKGSKGRLQIELLGEAGLWRKFQLGGGMNLWASSSGIILRKIRGYLEDDPSLSTVPFKSRYIEDIFRDDWSLVDGKIIHFRNEAQPFLPNQLLTVSQLRSHITRFTRISCLHHFIHSANINDNPITIHRVKFTLLAVFVSHTICILHNNELDG